MCIYNLESFRTPGKEKGNVGKKERNSGNYMIGYKVYGGEMGKTSGSFIWRRRTLLKEKEEG